jgi:FtsP/CotA-like multicopper oxidase with cupredoxin domain
VRGAVVTMICVAIAGGAAGDRDKRGAVPADWHPVAGQPLTQPAQRFAENGVLSVKLIARRRVIEVAGAPIRAQPFGRSIIGPTLHVSPGDTLETVLDNRTSEMTNIHFHGMHVSPRGIGDNVYRMFPPHSKRRSRIEIPPGHEPGTYWYHVHMHGDTEEQVMGGMSGLLIVEGLEDRLPPGLQDIAQQQLAIRDLEHRGGSAELNAANINPAGPTTRLVNGQFRPTMAIGSGETQMWRIGNVGADLFYDIALEGHVFTILAEDGDPVWEVTQTDHLVLPPGKRFDVLVQGGTPGSYRLMTRKFDEGFERVTNRKLATLNVAGPQTAPTTDLPTSLNPPSLDLSTAEIARERRFVFTLDTKGGGFKAEINGQTFDPDVLNVRAGLGTVEEWTLVNKSGEDHPFHIHVNDFQVMSVNGVPYDAHGRQDVVIIPRNGGRVVIRNPFEDYTGKFVFHCHILGHEDAGMMQTIKVVRGPGSPTHERG